MFENEKFDEILTILRKGGVILFPTDTIWGVACDATNEEAVKKLRALKNQPDTEGVVSIVSSLDMLKLYVDHVHPRLETLISYHNRPLTIIYDEGIGLASNVAHKDKTVAVRIVQDAFCRELIEQLGRPMVASAAAVWKKTLPAHFGEISSDSIEKVDFIVKYKQDTKEKEEPSVIVRLNDVEELDFIRE